MKLTAALAFVVLTAFSQSLLYQVRGQETAEQGSQEEVDMDDASNLDENDPKRGVDMFGEPIVRDRYSEVRSIDENGGDDGNSDYDKSDYSLTAEPNN